jgi:hypothetical protein
MTSSVFKSDVFIRLINISLRGMTLVSKFLLIFFLAGFLEPKELGLYGLLAATIGYSMYLLGFEFTPTPPVNCSSVIAENGAAC